ncbi:hypothetical protein IJ732_00235 [bacterium]|nr:hypothetical protein [bacterium]
MNTVNLFLKSLGEKIELHRTNPQNIIRAGNRKWLVNILPFELLQQNVKTSIETLVALDFSNLEYKTFPNDIKSPNYGDNWGRYANYIEINNRAIAEMQGEMCKNGIMSMIKILPAIPPSAKSWANCLILSQIFPNIFGDGYNKPAETENSIYGIKLGIGYSRNIINFDINFTPENQFKTFNDLAHFHGLKTGFRTVISADQIKISKHYENDVTFNWKNPEHQELFIEEHVKLINMGFEAVFIDSAKHIGGYDMSNYAGVGALPEYEQMQYILNEIRHRSGCTSISFIGEKSTEDFNRYENLGLTTGTAFIEPDNYDEVKIRSKQFKYNKNYAPGVEVSNDNDEGGRSYEERLNRINNVLFAYEFPSDKLASFMQMEDLFPLRYDTSTHHLMMCNPSYSTDGSAQSHWQNLFARDDGREYNKKAGELFFHALEL